MAKICFKKFKNPADDKVKISKDEQDKFLKQIKKELSNGDEAEAMEKLEEFGFDEKTLVNHTHDNRN